MSSEEEKLEILLANPQFQSLSDKFQDLLLSIINEVTDDDVSHFLSVSMQVKIWEMMDRGDDPMSILHEVRKHAAAAAAAGSSSSSSSGPKKHTDPNKNNNNNNDDLPPPPEDDDYNPPPPDIDDSLDAFASDVFEYDDDDDDYDDVPPPAADDDDEDDSKEKEVHVHVLRHKVDMTNTAQELLSNIDHQASQVFNDAPEDEEQSENQQQEEEEKGKVDPLEELQKQEAYQRSLIDGMIKSTWKQWTELIWKDLPRIKFDIRNSKNGTVKNTCWLAKQFRFQCACEPFQRLAFYYEKNHIPQSTQTRVFSEIDLATIARDHHHDQTTAEPMLINGFQAAARVVQHCGRVTGNFAKDEEIRRNRDVSTRMILVQMTLLLLKAWDNDEYAKNKNVPELHCQKESLAVHAIRIAYPTNESRFDLPSSLVDGMEAMLLMVIRRVAIEREQKAKGKQPTVPSASPRDSSSASAPGFELMPDWSLSWLYVKLLELRPYSETKAVHWIHLWLAMYQEKKQQVGPYTLVGNGEWLFNSRDTMLHAGGEAKNRAENLRVFYVFIVAFSKWLMATPTWFSTFSGAPGSGYVKMMDVIHFIISEYQLTDLKPETILLIVDAMRTYGLESLGIAAAAAADNNNNSSSSSSSSVVQWTALSILSTISQDKLKLKNSTLFSVYAIQRAVLAVASNHSAAVLFREIPQRDREEIWFTADEARCEKLQIARERLFQESMKAHKDTIAGGQAAAIPYFQEYAKWLLTLIPLFQKQKEDLWTQAKNEYLRIATEYSTSFESEVIVTYREVTTKHNSKMRGIFAQKFKDLFRQEEEARNADLSLILSKSVTIPYCIGAQQLLVDAVADFSLTVLTPYRTITAEYNARIAAKFRKEFESLAEHEQRQRQRIEANIRMPFENVSRMYKDHHRQVSVQALKYTEKKKDQDGMEFLINPRDNDVLSSFARLVPRRGFLHRLLQKGVYTVEYDGSQILYTCSKDPSKKKLKSIREVLQIPEEHWRQHQVPEGRTMIDELFALGVWVSTPTEDGSPYAYHATSQASTWNPHRNWCLPQELWKEDSSASMVFEPTCAFDANTFPTTTTATTEGGAAVDLASAGFGGSGGSSAASGVFGTDVILDLHGNHFTAADPSDDAAVTVAPGSELHWVAQWILQNKKPEVWKAVRNPANKMFVQFQYVPTGVCYDDICETLEVPEFLAGTENEESSPLAAMERDGVWVRAATEDGTPYAYHSVSARSVWTLETDWLVPPDAAE